MLFVLIFFIKIVIQAREVPPHTHRFIFKQKEKLDYASI